MIRGKLGVYLFFVLSAYLLDRQIIKMFSRAGHSGTTGFIISAVASFASSHFSFSHWWYFD